MLPTREQTLEFVHKYVSNEYQLLHAEMVGAAMKAVANRLGEDENLFEVTGLVHDWDYDQWPTEHPGHYEILRTELGVPEDVIEAIKGHADLSYPRPTKVAQTLLACDEFSGLLYAYCKMTGKYGEMKTSSIQKKIHKELNFAAKVNRDDVKTGISELGIPEEEFINLIRDTFATLYDK